MSSLGRRRPRSTASWAALAATTLGTLTLTSWNEGGPSTAARPDGAQLFRAKGCASCHIGPDSNPHVSGFPSLADALRWAADRRPGMTAEEYLTESIIAPGAFRSPVFAGAVGPTTGMPQLDLTSAETEALVAYLLGR